jgi:hypothetical protein
MLIDSNRFHAASERLARRALRLRIERQHLPIHDKREYEVLLRRAMLPRAWAKMAMRLWDRGHMIIDNETREVARRENFKNFSSFPGKTK